MNVSEIKLEAQRLHTAASSMNSIAAAQEAVRTAAKLIFNLAKLVDDTPRVQMTGGGAAEGHAGEAD